MLKVQRPCAPLQCTVSHGVTKADFQGPVCVLSNWNTGHTNLEIGVFNVGAAGSEPIKNRYQQIHFQVVMACPEYFSCYKFGSGVFYSSTTITSGLRRPSERGGVQSTGPLPSVITALCRLLSPKHRRHRIPLLRYIPRVFFMSHTLIVFANYLTKGHP